MKVATSSEFRNNAKRFLDDVQRGETYEIYRHGKPVAVVSPYRTAGTPHWKTAKPLSLPGVSLSRMIIAERRARRY
jgi:prevent-host-death family protein